MKKMVLLLLCVLFSTAAFFAFPCFAEQQEKQIVRVGWFYSDGVHAFTPDGTRTGYDYDYLQAISQYTNWEYEYYEGTWAECYERLKNGEIDLLGIVNKTPEREQIFEYSYTSAGTEMCCLFVSLDNEKYAYQDFENFDGMRIAVEDGTYQSQVLAEYAQNNGFSFTGKTYPTLAEAQKAVNLGQADALLSSNTDIISGFKAVAQFNPVPFYFATTKGNTKLLNELNYAINELFTYYPKFSNDLYNKYYGGNPSSQLVFSSAELEYIKSKPVVTVLCDPIWFPIESYDKESDTFTGIVPDLMNRISQKSGIDFLYQDSSSVDVLKSLGTGNEDTRNKISSITYDYKWAIQNRVKITQPFIDASIMCVTKENSGAPKTVALVELDYITEMVSALFPDLKPVYFDSMSKCIEAVSDGKIDCAYLNNYEAEYYMTIPKYKDLNFHTVDSFRQKLCLGISNDSDPRLFSIISKCLQSIPAGDIQNMIYANSYHVTPVTLESFARSYPALIVIVSLSFIALILGGAGFIVNNEIKNTRKLAIENERYHQLSEMSAEHIYEYSYLTDFLSFNSIPPNFLGGPNQIYNYSKFALSGPKGNGSGNGQNTLYSCLLEKKDFQKEVEILNTDGSMCWYRVSCKIIRDVGNQPIYAIGKIKNIQNEYEEKLHLIDCANRDGLTGLYNSKAYSEMVESNIKKGAAMLLIDVDRFKFINDNYGHYSGDEVLIQIAQKLEEVFQNEKDPIISRLGGDEFSVFLPEPNGTQELTTLLQTLLDRVAAIKIAPGAPITTLSMGCAIAVDQDTYVQLYKQSDRLLYDVKNNGRNHFKIL